MPTPVIGFIGEPLDLLIRQGGTFGPFTGQIMNPDGTPVDLTGSVLRGQIRRRALDASLLANLVVTIPAQVGAGLGQYTFGLTDETTAAFVVGELITQPESQGVWDFEWQDSLGRVIPLYYGKVKIQREVTRA